MYYKKIYIKPFVYGDYAKNKKIKILFNNKKIINKI